MNQADLELSKLPAVTAFGVQLISADIPEATPVAGRPRWRRAVAVGAAAAVAVVGAAVLFVNGEESNDRPELTGLQEIQASGGVGLEVFNFRSLAKMTATSSLVVEGSVSHIESLGYVGLSTRQREQIDEFGPNAESEAVPGETLLEASGGLEVFEATLVVDRAIHDPGELQPTELSVIVTQGPYSDWRVGDRGVFFLRPNEDSHGGYRVVSSQGRFLEADDGTLVSPNDEDSWIKELEALTLPELVAQIDSEIADGLPAPLESPLEK